MRVTAICVQSLSANILRVFYACNVTFGRLKRNHLDAKPDGSVTSTVMLCHVLMLISTVLPKSIVNLFPIFWHVHVPLIKIH